MGVAGHIAIGAAPAAAQDSAPPDQRLAAAALALAECAAAARTGEPAARAAADRAETLYRELAAVTRLEAEALTGRAQVISSCLIPLADFMEQGRLVGRSNELLEQALRADSTHVAARFTLAVNHYSVPAFLGRTAAAIAEFERLRAQLGDRPDVPILATVFQYLGDLYDRTGRRKDAVAAWQRGAELFPDHAGFRRRLDPEREDAAAPSYRLAPIVVEAGSYAVNDPRTATSLSKMEVYTTPGGAADVLQVFQTMPGVTRVTEGSDLYVRGGDPAESPVYVDGARLFYPGKFETLNGSVFGVLDPAVLRTAYFSAGGFSARYGNALSGVLDVETEGRPMATGWRAAVNLASAGGTYRLPLGSAAGTWGTFAVTRTGSMLRLHGRDDEYVVAPRAVEGMVGLAVEPRPGLDLRATALVESDDATRDYEAYGYRGAARSRGTTRLGTLTIRARGLDGAASARATISGSMRDSRLEFGVLHRDRTDRGASLRLDGELAPVPRVRLRTGLEAAYMDAEEMGTVPATDRLAPGSQYRLLEADRDGAWHGGGYLETEIHVSPRLAFIAGLRGDRLPGETESSLDPRFAAAYYAGDWTLRVGGGTYRQGRWRVSYRVPDAGSPSGNPTGARHLAVGAQRGGPFGLRVEAYLKTYGRYVPRGEGPPTVAGRVAGVDVLARWSGTARLNGWASYSYIDAVLDLADGERARAATDVTNTLTAVGKVRPFTRWEVGATARFGTGRPFTPILRAEPGDDARPVPVYGGIHSDRLPGYARLDSRLTYLAPAPRGMFVVYLEALNVLGRSNLMGYSYDASYVTRIPIHGFFADRTLVFGVEAQF